MTTPPPPVHVGVARKRFTERQVFDPADGEIREDVLRMVAQYLQDEGFVASYVTVLDEAKLRAQELLSRRAQLKKMRALILAGDWAEVDKLLSKPLFRAQKPFIYAVYKQQFLELIERQEFQKAFSFLTKRIKPLEALQSNPNEFRDMCYLLTSRSIQDVPSFRHWDGDVAAHREALVKSFQTMLESEASEVAGQKQVPPHRLLDMLQQAVLYQIEFSRYHPKVTPRVQTLLQDYHCLVIPNALRTMMRGHRQNVKCADFVGSEGHIIASGSSDNTVKLWGTENGQLLQSLEGHTSRIWDVTANQDATLLASASADGEVRIWSLSGAGPGGIAAGAGGDDGGAAAGTSAGTGAGAGGSAGVGAGAGSAAPAEGGEVVATFQTAITGHAGDVYSACFHPDGNYLATGGYDKTVRLYDVRSGTLVRTFTGHGLSVSSVRFNPLGNLIVSGSKDRTIKFWDIFSGVCVKTYSSHLMEVSSVAVNRTGTQLLSACKDNSNRLWDMRTARPILRLKGHENTSKNFVRCDFGPNDSVAVGGSEDGLLYLWDLDSGSILETLKGHTDTVYSAKWCPAQSLLVSCAHEGTVATWWWDEDHQRVE